MLWNHILCSDESKIGKMGKEKNVKGKKQLMIPRVKLGGASTSPPVKWAHWCLLIVFIFRYSYSYSKFSHNVTLGKVSQTKLFLLIYLIVLTLNRYEYL